MKSMRALSRKILFCKTVLRQACGYCTTKEVSKFHYSKRKFKLVRLRPGTGVLSFPEDIPKPSYVANPTVGNVYGIEYHNEEQIEKMRNSCKLARKILDATAAEIKVGVTSCRLDEIAHQLCIDNKCYPSSRLYKLYTKSTCISVNNIMIHGVPDTRSLYDGDIVTIDLAVWIDGYHGDVAETYLVGDVDEDGKHLVNVARRCRDAGIAVCRNGQNLSAIGDAISAVALAEDVTVVPNVMGHGIGTQFHTLPDVIHVAHEPEEEVKMKSGMTFTIEPVICEGKPDYVILSDGFTCASRDGGRSAQFEHTILITDDGAEILTE